MIGAVATGFGTAFSLILAIGSQNAFVLRQGLMREHVLPVILVCTLSDAILITAGVAGMGAAVAAFPVLLEAVMWGGALFLLVYGGLAARRALFPGRLDPAAKGEGSLRGAVATTLALTWLNPHVYLDTVVLLGSVSVPFVEEGEGAAFALGAMGASLVFFLCLGYGARAVAPLFASRAAWRVLDAVVALIMFAIASVLVRGAMENSVLTTALSQWTG